MKLNTETRKETVTPKQEKKQQHRNKKRNSNTETRKETATPKQKKKQQHRNTKRKQ